MKVKIDDYPVREFAEVVGEIKKELGLAEGSKAEDPRLLEAMVMDSRLAKPAPMWWAKREIERLRELITQEREECAKIADESAAADRRKGELFSKMGALDDSDRAYEDFAVTAEVIASRIRKRT